MYNLKLTQFWINLLVVPSWVGVIKTIGNIGIYHPRVFQVRSVPKQSYYLEYIMGAYFAIFNGGGEGKNIKFKVIKSIQR